MRRVVLLTTLIGLCWSASLAQWSVVSFPSSETLMDVHIYSFTDVVVQGRNSLWSSQDDGASWNQELALVEDQDLMDRTVFRQLSPETDDILSSLLAIGTDTVNNLDVVFRRGPFPTYAWEAVFVGAPGDSILGAGLGPSTYYLMGNGGQVWASTSAADSASWLPVSTGTTASLYNGTYAASLDAFAVAGDGLILLLYDTSSVGFVPFPTGISTEAIVPDEDRFITTEGSLPYAFAPLESDYLLSNEALLGPIAITDLSSWLGLSGNLALSTQNGIYKKAASGPAWERAPESDGWNLNAIDMVNAAQGIAVGPGGLVVQTLSGFGLMEPWVDVVLDSFYCLGSSAFATSLADAAHSKAWYLDGVFAGGGDDVALDLSTSGLHEVMHIAFNAVGADTALRRYEVLPEPLPFSWMLQDSFACFGGTPQALVPASDTRYRYALLDALSGETLDAAWGNGDTLALNGVPVSDSVGLSLVAFAAGLPDCATPAPDTLVYAIEVPVAKPANAYINAAFGEAIPLDHFSEDAHAFAWTFGSAASPGTSSLPNPMVSWSAPGPTVLNLTVSSAGGCLDSAQIPGPFIYEDFGPGNPCQVRVLRSDSFPETFADDDLVANRQAIDAFENRYVSNYYQDLYPQTTYGVRDTIFSEYGGVYMVKYDPQGTLKWRVRSVDPFGSFTDNLFSIHDVAVSPDGESIYLVGNARPSSVFYDAYGESFEFEDLTFGRTGFLIKLNKHGKLQWVLANEGSAISRLDIDPSGNIYAIGRSGTTHDFFNTDGSVYTPAFRPSWGMDFLARISPEGTYDWMLFSQNMEPTDVVAMDGGVCYGGKFYRSSLFASEIATPSGSIWSDTEAHDRLSIVFIDSAGQPQWRTGVRHTDADTDFFNSKVLHLGRDNNGNLYSNLRMRSVNGLEGEVLSADGSLDTFAFAESFGVFSFNKAGQFRWGFGDLTTFNRSIGYTVDPPGQSSLLLNVPTLLPAFDFLSTVAPDTFSIPNTGMTDMVLQLDSTGRPRQSNSIWPGSDGGVVSARFKNIQNSPNGRLYVNARLRWEGELPGLNIEVVGDHVWVKPRKDDIHIRLDDSLCKSPAVSVLASYGGLCLGDSVWVDFSMDAASLSSINSTQLWMVPLDLALAAPRAIDSIDGALTSGRFAAVWPVDFPKNVPFRLEVRSTAPVWSGFEPGVFELFALPEALGQRDTVCLGESMVLMADAHPDYAYAWTPGSGLSDSSIATPTWIATSNQTFTVDVSNVCGTIIDTVIVEVLPLPESGLAALDSICFGDTLLVEANPLYAYDWTWNPYISDLGVPDPALFPPGDFEFQYTISDSAGCSKADSMFVLVKPLPTIDFSGTESTVCVDQPFVLDALATGNQFLWQPTHLITDSTSLSTTASISTNTVFTLMAADSAMGCTSSESHTVSVYVPIPGTLSTTDSTIVAASGFQYQWYLDGTPIPSSDANVWMPTASGAYYVDIVYGDSCISRSDTVVWSISSLDPILDLGWSVSPVPANEVLQVCAPHAKPWRLQAIYAGNGRELFNNTTSDKCLRLETDSWPAGLYLLEAHHPSGRRTFKVVVEHP